MTLDDWSKVHLGSFSSSSYSSSAIAFNGHTYKIEEMYGRGFVWAQRVPPPPNTRVSLINPKNVEQFLQRRPKYFYKSELQERIEKKEFDLIVYPCLFLFVKDRFHSNVSLHLPFLGSVRDAYEGEWNRVLFVDSDDYPLEAQHWGPILEEMVVVNSNDGDNENKAKMFVRESHALDPKMWDSERLPPGFDVFGNAN